MPVNPDIRKVKKALREEFINIRKAHSPENKARFDAKITRRLLNLWAFREAETVLCYVSTSIEVDTREIINAALSAGKRVAVPLCADGTPQMDFYYIDSMDELKAKHFGILEPEADESRKYTRFSEGLCIVPALSFDRYGLRLGYGGGYYDRFLAGFGGVSAGLCYEDCVSEKLPGGRYDKRVDMVVTEKKLYKNS